jgi:hypothetical protein
MVWVLVSVSAGYARHQGRPLKLTPVFGLVEVRGLKLTPVLVTRATG